MKKYPILFLFIILCNFVTLAQKELAYKDITEGIAVFIDKDITVDQNGGAQAGVIISCPNNLSLTFQSNVDKVVDVYARESNGIDSLYYLRFIVGRYQWRIYENRKLEILSSGFTKLIIPLDLAPSARQDYYVYDPNSGVGLDCYNDFSRKAAGFFQKALYEDAKQQYETAKQCSNAPIDGVIEQRIAIIDTIQVFRKIADDCFDMSDYKTARDYYLKIRFYNNDDDFVNKRIVECQTLQTQTCVQYSKEAEYYYTEHEYEKAKELYEKMANQNCPQQILYNERIFDINKILARRAQKATVLTYEVANKISLGFSVGGYKNKKGGGYFTLKTNPAFFNMLRSKYEKAVHPEIDASAGGNFRPVKNKYTPIWINIGIGYTGVGAYHYQLEEDGKEILYNGEDLPENVKPSSTLYSAISPEIGLLGKLSLGKTARVGIALRYTLQYRFALEPDVQDYIKAVAHGFGFGICF